MEEEIAPHENDILLGRGGKNNKHVGNEQLRMFAREQVTNYRKSTKKEKSNISRELVKRVRRLNPPGRFLKRHHITGLWEEMGEEIAREKTSQALRDAVTSYVNIASNTDVRKPYEIDHHHSVPPQPDHHHPVPPQTFNRASHSTSSEYTQQRALSMPPLYGPQKHHHLQPRITPQRRQSDPSSVPPLAVVSPDDPKHWVERYSSSTSRNERYFRTSRDYHFWHQDSSPQHPGEAYPYRYHGIGHNNRGPNHHHVNSAGIHHQQIPRNEIFCQSQDHNNISLSTPKTSIPSVDHSYNGGLADVGSFDDFDLFNGELLKSDLPLSPIKDFPKDYSGVKDEYN